MEFTNVYDDARRAQSYAALQFPGTYYLAYRDLPEIILGYVKEGKALDFGCGTGRSTRFLQKLGLNAVGIDIAADMIALARNADPEGDYHLVQGESFSLFNDNTFDVVLSAFTFDNIPTIEKKVVIFRELHRVLKVEGIIVNLVSAPEIYTNEWASFSTKDFPENGKARSGDKVKIIMTDVEDERPVEDIVWMHEDYLKVYAAADLKLIESRKPLARENEPYPWVNEMEIAPWVIYVLKKGGNRVNGTSIR